MTNLTESFSMEDTTNNSLADFKDPFHASFCKQIMIIVDHNIFPPYEIRFMAWIKFANGDISGEQHIKADDFPSLMKKVHHFLEAMKKQETTKPEDQ